MATDRRLKTVFTLRLKLILIACGVVLTLSSLLVGGMAALRKVDELKATEIKIGRTVEKFRKTMIVIHEILDSGASEEARKALSSSFVDSGNSLDKLLEDLADAQAEKEIRKTVVPALASSESYIRRLLKFDEERYAAASEEGERLAKLGHKGMESAIAGLETVKATAAKTAEEETSAILIMTGAGAAAGLIVIALLFFTLYRNLVLPVYLLADFADKIAGGDLSARIDIEPGDEVGVLARALKRLAENLRGDMSSIKSLTAKLAADARTAGNEVLNSEKDVKKRLNAQEGMAKQGKAASENLERLTGEAGLKCEQLRMLSCETSEANAGIAGSIRKVAEKSDAHAFMAEETSRKVNAMFVALSEISASLQQLTATAEELAASITQMQGTVGEVDKRASESSQAAAAVLAGATGKGLDSVRMAEQSIGVIERSMLTLTDAIRKLDERAGKIGFITDLIDDVADQTALLALNAAILAAQAGKHGEGFAVVADEVKALAGRTSQSTREIAGLIKTIQADAAQSVKMAGTGMDSVTEGVKRFGEVRHTLEEIKALSERSSELSSFIETAMAEQAAMSQQIFQSIHIISKEVETVSGSTFNLEESGREMLSAMDRIRLDSLDMSHLMRDQTLESARIVTASDRTAADASAIVLHLTDIARTGREIGEIIRSLHEGALSLGYQVADLGTLVNQFDSQTGKVVTELEKFSV